MVKVLGKTFQILEFVASRGGEPVTPAELAAAVGLPHPTCMRILKDLVEFGYLVQISRQKGYARGPMCHAVGGGKRYMQDLVDVADPLIRRCSEVTTESVLLAVESHARRYIICHHNGNPRLNIRLDDLWYDDIYETATGRLLLAHADEDELKRVLKKLGEPSKTWPETNGRNGLRNELQSIRKNGVAMKRGSAMLAVAHPVVVDGRFTASLGCSILLEGLDEKAVEMRVREVAETAKRIGEQCSKKTRLG